METELIFDANEGSAFAALAEVPVVPRAWRYDRARPWQTPEPHLWTPEQATLPPGPVWVVCAQTKTGNPSLRVYPLRDRETGAPVVFAVGALAASVPTARLTRREVILAGAAALVAFLLPVAEQTTREPLRLAPPEFALAALADPRSGVIQIPHAGVALVRLSRLAACGVADPQAVTLEEVRTARDAYAIELGG